MTHVNVVKVSESSNYIISLTCSQPACRWPPGAVEAAADVVWEALQAQTQEGLFSGAGLCRSGTVTWVGHFMVLRMKSGEVKSGGQCIVSVTWPSQLFEKLPLLFLLSIGRIRRQTCVGQVQNHVSFHTLYWSQWHVLSLDGYCIHCPLSRINHQIGRTCQRSSPRINEACSCSALMRISPSDHHDHECSLQLAMQPCTHSLYN